MQVIPVGLLIIATILDLVNAVIGVASNFEFLPELGKWTNFGSTILCVFATLLSAGFLIAGKYSGKLLGFGVTFLSSAMSATFLAWTISWFK